MTVAFTRRVPNLTIERFRTLDEIVRHLVPHNVRTLVEIVAVQSPCLGMRFARYAGESRIEVA